MKLARIILPKTDNAGAEIWFDHQDLKHALLKEFGGYTSFDATGAWLKPDGKVLAEEVVVYDVAMERAAVVKFREIARDTARQARQECVMIVTPIGDVEFVKPSEIISPEPLDDVQYHRV